MNKAIPLARTFSMPARLSQRGLSLIELMISITIGLLILAALSSMFVNQTRARTELDKANRMIDNGRYALELLSDSFRMAGYYGTYAPTGAPASLPAPCDTTILVDPAQNLGVLQLPVQGYDVATATGTISSPPCSLVNTAGAASSLKPGSDIVVLRRAGTVPVAQAAIPNTNTTIYLQVSSCQHDDVRYRISATPSELGLGQLNKIPDNNCAIINNVINIAAPFADARPFKVEVYYVSPNNNAGDGIPTLRRLELTTTSSGIYDFVDTPLVEGIEFLQVEYGIDGNLDGVPDSYDSCAACSLLQWSNVVSVKLHLISRNTEASQGYADPNTYTLGAGWTYTPSGSNASYKRHAYTQVVRLINPSGKREAP